MENLVEKVIWRGTNYPEKVDSRTGQMNCFEARVTATKGERSEVPQQSSQGMQGVRIPCGMVYQALQPLLLYVRLG